MNFANGLKILRKITEEERNWRSGMLQIEELLQTAEQADAVLRDKAKQHAELEETISRLCAEETALKRSVQNFQKESGGWKADLQEKERIKTDRLNALDDQIDVKETRLAELMEKLEEIRGRVTVS